MAYLMVQKDLIVWALEFTLGYAAGMVAKFAVQKVIQNTKKCF